MQHRMPLPIPHHTRRHIRLPTLHQPQRCEQRWCCVPAAPAGTCRVCLYEHCRHLGPADWSCLKPGLVTHQVIGTDIESNIKISSLEKIVYKTICQFLCFVTADVQAGPDQDVHPCHGGRSPHKILLPASRDAVRGSHEAATQTASEAASQTDSRGAQRIVPCWLLICTASRSCAHQRVKCSCLGLC